ncbi:hypothetical protein ACIBG8_14465 [Nonomuraea sp. NPDC050556]
MRIMKLAASLLVATALVSLAPAAASAATAVPVVHTFNFGWQ